MSSALTPYLSFPDQNKRLIVWEKNSQTRQVETRKSLCSGSWALGKEAGAVSPAHGVLSFADPLIVLCSFSSPLTAEAIKHRFFLRF